MQNPDSCDNSPLRISIARNDAHLRLSMTKQESLDMYLAVQPI